MENYSMTIAQAANTLKVTKPTIYRYLRVGLLNSITIAKGTLKVKRLSYSEVESLAAKLQSEAAEMNKQA